MTTRPSAFLCHSSTDKALVTKLAADLRVEGVDAWLDKWRIMPGDSLRRRIDEGIAGATHFFALLSLNSIASEWVQTELDAALVEKICGNLVLVPVLFGLEDSAVPPTLRGIRWVCIDDYAAGLRELVNVCYRVTDEPPLGPPPARLAVRAPHSLGLTHDAYRVGVSVCSLSDDGIPLDRILSFTEVSDRDDLSADEVVLACDELAGRGYLHRRHVRRERIVATWRLFFDFDPHVKGWSVQDDALSVATTLVNSGEDGLTPHDLAERLQWAARRLNPACAFLETRGLAQIDKVMGNAPFFFLAVRKTPTTIRFVRDNS